MRIAIGLPAMIPGTDGATILEWARRAEAGPFSSLAVLDRVVYDNYEPLIALAVAAGATTRIRLMTTVLLATTRNAAILAKQAASLDALSQGRLTLGLGIGAREDDLLAAGESYRGRGKRFEEQLTLMRRVWAGEPALDGVGAIGPRPFRAGGPELLLGGYTPQAVQRVGRWADGYISGGGSDPQAALRFYQLAEQSWREEGRTGTPRFVAASYWALGPNAQESIRSYIAHYYGGMDERFARMIAAIPTTEDALRQRIAALRDVGVDEFVLWPGLAALDQVERLAQVVA